MSSVQWVPDPGGYGGEYQTVPIIEQHLLMPYCPHCDAQPESGMDDIMVEQALDWLREHECPSGLPAWTYPT